MEISIIRESKKRSTVCLTESRLFLLAMCLIAITCTCFAQDTPVAEVSNPSPPDRTEPALSPAAPVFTYGAAQQRPVNILAEMRANYPDIYSRYQSGRRMKTAGWILTGTGIGAFIVGIAAVGVAIEEDDDEIGAAGAVCLVTGTACLAAGIPVLAVGSGKKRRALRDFNSQYYSTQSRSPHLQLNLYPGKVGLAYVF